MSANGRVTIGWADGEHVFNIAKVAQILELQDKCAVGAAELLTRLLENRWYFNDVRETIRIGLIGGGMKPVDALTLTKRYVDERPWAESVPVARTIVMAAMVGVPGEEVGKSEADQTKSEAAGSSMKMAALSDPPSTGSVPGLDSTLARWTT